MVKKTDTNVPNNDKARKPTAKKKFSLADFKKKTGTEAVASKPLQWISCDDALQEATGLPGFAKGYVNLCRGYSNTGKSTAIMKGIVNVQKMGILPIIIDTENNIDEGNLRLTEMGFDWGGDYILIHNTDLLDRFGKLQDSERKEASIEDLAKCMYYYLDQQDAGNIPMDMCFIIDSIGTLNCIKTINALEKNTTDNNMWNAGAYEKAFMSLLNSTIPSSRRVNNPYTNTVIAVQKIWYDSMNKVIKHKGGETWFFGARLIYHFGGIMTHGTKRITATSKKRELNYGFENKVNVAKNHIDGELGGISMEGKIVSTPTGFVYPDRLEEYKKANILIFRRMFDDDTLTADAITIKSRDMDSEGNPITIPSLIQTVDSPDSNELKED